MSDTVILRCKFCKRSSSTHMLISDHVAECERLSSRILRMLTRASIGIEFMKLVYGQHKGTNDTLNNLLKDLENIAHPPSIETKGDQQ